MIVSPGEEISVYPREAIRKAIVNALVHRDYLLSSTDIELSIYEDRMEIIHPWSALSNSLVPPLLIASSASSRPIP